MSSPDLYQHSAVVFARMSSILPKLDAGVLLGVSVDYYKQISSSSMMKQTAQRSDGSQQTQHHNAPTIIS